MHEMQCRQSISRVAEEVKALAPHVHPPVPNPAPLGLIAFGLTTALLQMKHTRMAGDEKSDMEGTDAVVLGFAMFFGGLLQLIAGLGEVKRNNIFGYTAFCLYGGFWMSLGTVQIVQLLKNNGEFGVDEQALQCMLFLVGLYTFILWLCTFRMNMTIHLLFFLLATTCFLLVGGVRNETIDKVGGYFGIATSIVAYWLAAAELINDIIGKGTTVIPLGTFSSNPFKFSGAVHVPGRTQDVQRGAMLQESRFGRRFSGVVRRFSNNATVENDIKKARRIMLSDDDESFHTKDENTKASSSGGDVEEGYTFTT